METERNKEINIGNVIFFNNHIICIFDGTIRTYKMHNRKAIDNDMVWITSNISSYTTTNHSPEILYKCFEIHDVAKDGEFFAEGFGCIYPDEYYVLEQI